MLTRAEKADVITGLSERFGKAKAAFVVDYKGLNVEEVTKLRKTLYPHQSEMKVVRNTYVKRALQDHPETSEALSEVFEGTNAVVFAYEDGPAAAKVLTEFGKEAEELQVKTGFMDGQALSSDRIKYLATLPSREELQAKLLGTFQAPMSKFVSTLEAVPGGLARVLSAYKDQKEEQS